MKNYLAIACLLLCSFSAAVRAQDEPALLTDAFPTLVQDALVNSNRIGPKSYWVIGVEHSTRQVEQTYVVMVPGSEGGAGRYEQKTRKVPVLFPIPHRYAVDQVIFTDVNGKSLDREAATALIAKNRSFLFVVAGKTVSNANRRMFSDDLILVTPKPRL